MMALIADLWENVRVALGGLASNKLRSALTMLGVVIGVGAVIGLMSIGEGAQASHRLARHRREGPARLSRLR